MREEMTYICPNCKSVTYRFESLSDRCPMCHNSLVKTQFTKAEWQGKSPEEQMKIINALSAISNIPIIGHDCIVDLSRNMPIISVSKVISLLDKQRISYRPGVLFGIKKDIFNILDREFSGLAVNRNLWR